jgi:hypothetical protein
MNPKTDMRSMSKLYRINVYIFFIIAFFPRSLSASDAQDQTQANPAPVIVIDNNYSEWDKIPEQAVFTKQFSPYYFNKEQKSKAIPMPITQSVYWGYNGTQIRVLKAFATTASYYFNLSTFSPLCKGTIFFLYLYKGREAGVENQNTIEIAVNGSSGENSVLLWSVGSESPVIIGKCVYDTTQLECEVSLNLLPVKLRDELPLFTSFDLTSCFFDSAKGIYEEFFFTTIFFKDIVTPDQL